MTQSIPMTNVSPKPEPKETKTAKTPEPTTSGKVQLLRPKGEPKERLPQRSLALRFSPYAWAKLLFFRDAGGTEIGGFGITSSDDLLYVEDFVTVKQEVTCVSVSFDDNAVADFFEGQVDQGRKPEQFARLWLHSHPGNCPQPSGTDEATFARVFGKCDWAVLAVVAREGKTYARLRFNVGPGGQLLVPMEVDYAKPFPAADPLAWIAEYKANVHPERWERPSDRFIHENSPGLAETDANLGDAHEDLDEMGAGFLGDPDSPWWWND